MWGLGWRGIFCYVLFCLWMSNYSNTIWKAIFPVLNFFCIFVRNHFDHVYVALYLHYLFCFFFSPYSGLLIYESISLLVLHNLDYYSYIISFKLGRLILPTLFFFLSIVLAILVPLPFWIISYKLSCWNFQKNYIKYVYQFENWIPFYVESPNSWA